MLNGWLCSHDGGAEGACAEFHSRAFRIALETVSSGEILQSSKISLFLAVQISQQIQGKISDIIPIGGKQAEVLQAFKASVKAVMFM